MSNDWSEWDLNIFSGLSQVNLQLEGLCLNIPTIQFLYTCGHGDDHSPTPTKPTQVLSPKILAKMFILRSYIHIFFFPLMILDIHSLSLDMDVFFKIIAVYMSANVHDLLQNLTVTLNTAFFTKHLTCVHRWAVSSERSAFPHDFVIGVVLFLGEGRYARSHKTPF